MPKSKIITPPPGRLTILPPPKTLEEFAETCERHARNCTMNILDCADCQDCSDSEIFIYNTQGAQWAELAGDIRAAIARQK